MLVFGDVTNGDDIFWDAIDYTKPLMELELARAVAVHSSGPIHWELPDFRFTSYDFWEKNI